MASGPYAAPWSDTGRLQGDIDRLSCELHRKADSHEISTLRSSMDSLESTVREINSSLDSLCSELQNLQENFRESLDVLQQMAEKIGDN